MQGFGIVGETLSKTNILPVGVVLNEFYVNVCIPQLKLINFIFLFVMKEAFLPLILNCENIFKTFNIMKVLMVFCSTLLQVVWDYCAGILIF